MATAEQIKSLIKAHMDSDNDRFKTVVLQIAAYEAKHGHDTFARELKQYVDKIGKTKGTILHLNNSCLLYTSMPFRLLCFSVNCGRIMWI